MQYVLLLFLPLFFLFSSTSSSPSSSSSTSYSFIFSSVFLLLLLRNKEFYSRQIIVDLRGSMQLYLSKSNKLCYFTVRAVAECNADMLGHRLRCRPYIYATLIQ